MVYKKNKAMRLSIKALKSNYCKYSKTIKMNEFCEATVPFELGRACHKLSISKPPLNLRFKMMLFTLKVMDLMLENN